MKNLFWNIMGEFWALLGDWTDRLSCWCYRLERKSFDRVKG